MDNIRLYVRGGCGGMGLPRLGGQGGNGGDVWVMAKNGVTLKQIKDKHPDKRFTAAVGSNSRWASLVYIQIFFKLSYAEYCNLWNCK